MEAPRSDPRLLPRCLRRGAAEGLHEDLTELHEPGWRQLVDQAVWLGVAPQLYFRLGGMEHLVPGEHLTRLQESYLHCKLSNQAVLDQLTSIVGETEDAGLPVLVLKGAYLANCVYEEAALRPMGDIDVLARPGEAEAVQALLKELGYEEDEYPDSVDPARLHHLTPLIRRGSVEVEVHHGLEPDWAPFRTDVEALWARARATSVDGSLVVRHPAPDDVLLHLCAHAAFNDQFRTGLPAVGDIDAVVWRAGGDLDWDRLVETGNSDGRARFVFSALGVASELLGTRVPSRARDSLAHDGIDSGIVSEAVDYVLSTAQEPSPTVRGMSAADSASSKLTALWRGVFPPPEILRRISGLDSDAKVGIRHYVARASDLLRRRSSQVVGYAIGLVTGSSSARAARDKERRRRAIRRWAVRGRGHRGHADGEQQARSDPAGGR